MQKSSINPGILQQQFEAAANAGLKGQAQWFTPPEWAEALTRPLPNWRHTIVDLTCGNGSLLAGATRLTTQRLLGCDIEPLKSEIAQLKSHFVQADVTRFYPLLKAVGFQADLWVANFPWDHHWHRTALAPLADTTCPAVGWAFGAHDGRTTRTTIDSTVAGICMMLDLMSPCGEGLVIANEATLQRLVFAPKAPHAALRAHVWAHLVVEGNICQASRKGDFQTGVLYIARGHNDGPLTGKWGDDTVPLTGLGQAIEAVNAMERDAGSLRRGARARSYLHTAATADLWAAAAEEWRIRQHQTRPQDNAWNIWLDDEGCIRTNLSVFEQKSGRVDQAQAVRLFRLNGRRPSQLIQQTAERKALKAAAFGDTWRVQPHLQRAVEAALIEYDAVRAPLYPLNAIQRLGYLDENDTILCVQDLAPHFKAGERYPMETETMAVNREGRKLNLIGEWEDVEWNSSELAFWIVADTGRRLFMDDTLREKHCRISIQGPTEPSPIDHTLQDLVEHFEIPEVPDVSLRDPEGFQQQLARLTQIEDIANGN